MMNKNSSLYGIENHNPIQIIAYFPYGIATIRAKHHNDRYYLNENYCNPDEAKLADFLRDNLRFLMQKIRPWFKNDNKEMFLYQIKEFWTNDEQITEIAVLFKDGIVKFGRRSEIYILDGNSSTQQKIEVYRIKSERENHYDWLEKYLPKFMNDIAKDKSTDRCSFENNMGIISAHGDKASSYRDFWEKRNIPYIHGVAIFLMSYCWPFSNEVRQINDWIPIQEWVVKRYSYFKQFFPFEE